MAVARLVLRRQCRAWVRGTRADDPAALQRRFETKPTTAAGIYLARWLGVEQRCFHVHPLLPHHLDPEDRSAGPVVKAARGLARLVRWIADNPVGPAHAVLLRRTARLYQALYREWSRRDRRKMLNELGKMRYQCTMAIRAIKSSGEPTTPETKRYVAGHAARLERIDQTALRVGGRAWLRKIRQWTPEKIPVLNDLREIHATCRRALLDTLRDDLKQSPARVDRFRQNLEELLRSVSTLLRSEQRLAFERTIDVDHIAESLERGTFDASDACDLAKMLDYWIVTLQCRAEDEPNKSWLRNFLRNVNESDEFVKTCPADELVEILSHSADRMSRMIQRIHDAARRRP